MKNLVIIATTLALVAGAFATPAVARAGGDDWVDAPQPHYEVPPDYDSNAAMHPYTSGLGPCTQGYSAGCTAPRSQTQAPAKSARSSQ